MLIGSLFSGIGGLELGLERATGGRTIWQVEQNEYARAVLAKHWPQAKRYEDVREVGAHNLEPVDILCGGFPCQDISLAGKGAGITGSRSGLWTEYARIIREIRPRYVVVENVANLCVRGLGTVLGDLAAVGYNAIWDCVPAAAVGAHHRRDRVFVVAYSDSVSIHSKQEFGQKCKSPSKPERHGQNRSLADANGTRPQRQRRPGEVGQARAQEASRLFRRSIQSARPWKPEPDVGRVANGVPNRVDRLRALGNAVVPQVAEAIGRVLMDIDQHGGA
tara:strand:- start:410 stop:1240 length:831 start_codon:yes stop_codon:yes gene_type:complete